MHTGLYVILSKEGRRGRKEEGKSMYFRTAKRFEDVSANECEHSKYLSDSLPF